MKIPEPARRAWTGVLECVDEVFRTREGKRGWALHGGTLLAMRWDGHRESTNIDLLIGADAATTLSEYGNTAASLTLSTSTRTGVASFIDACTGMRYIAA